MTSDGALLISGRGKPDPETRIEVCRSFAYKLSLKNPDGSPTYESCDFFCSSKAACEPGDRDEVSRDLDEFCMDEVMESVRAVKERRAKKQAGRAVA